MSCVSLHCNDRGDGVDQVEVGLLRDARRARLHGARHKLFLWPIATDRVLITPLAEASTVLKVLDPFAEPVEPLPVGCR